MSPALTWVRPAASTCHAAIFQDSLANRHTQTYYRGAQLRGLPRPDRPLADPTDPKVTHAIKEVDGALWEETRVGDSVLRSLIEYAFGTSERYLTMVSRDAQRSIPHGAALVLPHRGRPGLGSNVPGRQRSDQARGLPGRNDRRAG